MKKLLLATSCLALTATASMAADLPMSMPAKSPVMAAPVFSWTGCYLGAHVGGGTTSLNSEGALGKGALGGGQAGCNYQDGNWVFGLEGEGSWSGVTATTRDTEIPNILNPTGLETFSNTTKQDYIATIAARAGITFDRTMIYGKGGWAWSHFKNDVVDFCCSVGQTGSTSSFAGTLDGFLVGVGIEHALTRNWTIKAEYNFINFGTKEVTLSQCNVPGPCAVTGTTSFGVAQHIFKFGANYLFDIGGGPLVARY